ncbi:hypothetical protein [Microbacterium sp. SS28]|uniref:hypothetical protein n=1 Tax=Microbacterium sp. SS28 TaxID=2919948 RepID=UPI0035AF4851
MDHRSEVREFLAGRLHRITPDQAALPAYGGSRRVPGLGREEVAMLALRRRPPNARELGSLSRAAGSQTPEHIRRRITPTVLDRVDQIVSPGATLTP